MVRRLEIPVDIEALLKRGALEQNIVIAPGDTIIVPFKRDAEERILVVGEVRTPTTIAFRQGLTLLDAFVEAGGGTEYADLDSVKVVRGPMPTAGSRNWASISRGFSRRPICRGTSPSCQATS